MLFQYYSLLQHCYVLIKLIHTRLRATATGGVLMSHSKGFHSPSDLMLALNEICDTTRQHFYTYLSYYL